MRFLGYVISLQGIYIEDEQIEIIYDWLEPWLIWDIQVFFNVKNHKDTFFSNKFNAYW